MLKIYSNLYFDLVFLDAIFIAISRYFIPSFANDLPNYFEDIELVPSTVKPNFFSDK